jgi:all-trans-retinol dehydrogenase (NAD+)
MLEQRMRQSLLTLFPTSAGITHQSDYVAAKHGLVGMQESVSVRRTTSPCLLRDSDDKNSIYQLYYEMNKMYKTPYVRTSIAMIGHTRTALFDSFNVGVLGRFMAPSLEPTYVASLVVDAFEAQESRIILTPFANNLLPGIKAFPSFMRDFLQWSSGGDGADSSRPSAAQLGHRAK